MAKTKLDSKPKFNYGVVNGKLAILKTIEGNTIPVQPERVECPEK